MIRRDRAEMDTRREKRQAVHLAALAWLGAAISYLASEELAAFVFTPRYSYAHNYISDLGVPVCGSIFDGRSICSPLHGLMNGGFVLQGVLFVAGALATTRLLATPARYGLFACALANGIGISLVGIYPETAASGAHALGALLAIVFGNATAFVSAFAFRELGLPRLHQPASLALPLLAATAFTVLLVARARGTTVLVPDGIWERASVYTITAWELATALALVARTGGLRLR